MNKIYCLLFGNHWAVATNGAVLFQGWEVKERRKCIFSFIPFVVVGFSKMLESLVWVGFKKVGSRSLDSELIFWTWTIYGMESESESKWELYRDDIISNWFQVA